MIRRPPRSTRTDTLFPYTTRFRSGDRERQEADMNDKLVTLIGGGGFVGRYVAQALLKAGARVRIAQRDPRQAWFLKPLGGLGQTQFVAADVRRPDSLARAVAGADADRKSTRLNSSH